MREHVGLLMLVLLLLPGAPASGQTTIAITGGVNFASTDVDLGSFIFATRGESIRRPSIGLAATFPISESLGLSLGGSYSTKGRNLKFPFADIDEPGSSAGTLLAFSYLEFTALGKLRIPLEGDRVRAHLLAGPALALEISCQLAHKTVAPNGVETKESGDCDGNDGLDRSDYDIGLAAGAGIELGLLEGWSLSVGVLYTLGLIDIDKTDESRMKHRVVALQAGLVYSMN